MEELRLRSNPIKPFSMSGKIFGKHSFSFMTFVQRELKPIYRDNRFRRIAWLGVANFLSLIFLLHWCNVTKSMGLLSCTCLTFFDTLCLCICALSIWVEQKKPNSHYTFGFDRFEVLAIFVSTAFTFISSIFIIWKSVWRWSQHSQVLHVGLLLPGVLLSFISHCLITYCMRNKGMNLVICASDASWLQNRIASINQSLCQWVPGLVTNSCPRLNPFKILGFASGGILFVAVLLMDILNYQSADAVAGIVISVFICITMFPLSAYTGKILLQGTPPHVKDLLDKCLREVSTLDGVLEYRNEHFWLLGFDKIVGTIHVRIRRDANEQIVLSHLLNKLSSLVADITIQIFKDEWAWNSSIRQVSGDPFMKFSPGNESYALQIPNTASVASSEKTNSNSGAPFKAPYVPTYPDPGTRMVRVPDPGTRTHEIRSSPAHFSAVPLPPSLSTPKTQAQEFAIEMPPGTNLVQKHSPSDSSVPGMVRQPVFNLEGILNSKKYNKELIIDPLFTKRPDYIKSYKS